MKEISYRLRVALINSITPLNYEGVLIPVHDNTLPPGIIVPTVNGAECYVIINSQTNSETTDDKCQVRLDANINFDVITKYPHASGGYLNAEKIGELIMMKVNRFLSIADFKLLKVDMNFNQNIFEQGTSQYAFRKIISYRFDVYEE